MGSRRGRHRNEDGDAAICVEFVSASKYRVFGQSREPFQRSRRLVL